MSTIARVIAAQSHVHLVIDRQREVIASLIDMIDETRSDTDGRYPPPHPGCIDCTSGTTPNDRNTGRCAYHEGLRLLAGKKDDRKSIDATLRLECLLQAQSLEGRIEALPDMPPAVRTLLARCAELFNKVAK